MCLAQGSQLSDVDEARTRGPSVSSQALDHSATVLLVLFYEYVIITPLNLGKSRTLRYFCESVREEGTS